MRHHDGKAVAIFFIMVVLNVIVLVVSYQAGINAGLHQKCPAVTR